MRIGISTSVIQNGRSGVGQHVLSLVRALADETQRDEFILFVLEHDLPLFAFANPAIRFVPVPERFRPPVRNIAWHQFALPVLARRLRLDVLHVPSYRRLLWARPCALVATIHDLAPFRVSGKYDPMRMFYGRIAVRKLARRQDQVIAVSRDTANDLIRWYGIDEKRITVIPNGIDHHRFQPGSPAKAKASICRRTGANRPFFLYVARLEHPAKNHVRLIAGFERFKTQTGSPWQLVLAGSDWHGAEVIHQRVLRSPFTSDIHRLGFVEPNDLPCLYQAADLFVFPSLHEGFGMPPIEAMACGCPVMSSARGALADVVGDAAALVDPDDEKDIASGLARLSADKGERDRLRAAGLTHARRFDWHNAARHTLDVYARAGARHGHLQAARSGLG